MHSPVRDATSSAAFGSSEPVIERAGLEFTPRMFHEFGKCGPLQRIHRMLHRWARLHRIGVLGEFPFSGPFDAIFNETVRRDGGLGGGWFFWSLIEQGHGQDPMPMAFRAPRMGARVKRPTSASFSTSV